VENSIQEPVVRIKARTLREPEQAQGDSMAERRSSSSSWQILHCRSGEEQQVEHASSSCSIIIIFFLLLFPALSIRELRCLWLLLAALPLLPSWSAMQMAYK
jgi:hypothetical protein